MAELHNPSIIFLRQSLQLKLMINWSVGKRNRLRRLIDDSGAILAVPLDHGYSVGKSKGLVDLNKTVQNVIEGGASCVIVQRGMVRNLAMNNNSGLMIHVSGSTSLSSRPNYKIPTGSVKDTIKLGADGISCHVNIGPDEDAIMLQDFSKLSLDADKYNLPLMAMMYVRDNMGVDDVSVSALSHAVRVAEETGADIVKVLSTAGGIDFDEVVQGTRIPVVVAGGSISGDFDGFLKTIRNCIISGASGVSVGRNIFEANDQKLAMQKVKETVVDAIKEVGSIEILS